ncbi:MAG: discoidin domain-containing protein [Xanthomonadaceae bacterium]|nr:discoidin domain-containing protein [Xanthomonadaceae bacterium]
MTRLFSALALTLATAAAPAHAADGKPELAIPKGGTPIACDGTPFGRYLPLGIDQEVVVARRPASNIPSLFQLSGGPLAAERELLGGTAPLANATRIASTTADLDGDGDEEFILATARFDGTFSVSTYTRSPSAGNALVQIDTWNYTVTGETWSDLQVATADLLGQQNGVRQIVVGLHLNGTVTAVGLLTGAGGTIAHPDMNWQYIYATSGGNFAGATAMRMVAGKVIAEPREQVVLVTRRSTGTGPRIGYTILRPGVVNGLPSLIQPPGGFVEESTVAGDLSRLTVHLADVGGSAAAELVVGEQITEGGLPRDIRTRMRYFVSTRDANRNLVSVALGPTTGLDYNISSTGFNFALATGEMDRRPDAEIALVREIAGNQLRVELLDATFNVAGFPVQLGPASPAAVATAPLVATGTSRIEAAIGDANGDAVGDVYVAFREIAGGGNFAQSTKLRRFAFDPPASPDAFPAPGTLALRASYDFPSGLPDAQDFTIGTPDIDQDSVIAKIGATCRRVVESHVRSVVKLPPYWTALQGTSPGANAAIGRSATNGSALELRYGTFSSHDISGYVGLQVGGQVFGIGSQVTAKVTAGGNWESNRTELRTSESSQTVTETHQQSAGEGLVVEEQRVYDCYEYDVLRGGQPAASSNLRTCEIVRSVPSNTPNGITPSDLVTWDTSTAAGTAGQQPANWVPLHPDWANLALFRPTSTIPPGFVHPPNVPTAITDGNFDTEWRSRGTENQSYAQIDLGSVQEITNIRIWPGRTVPSVPEGVTIFRDVRVYASETPITGNGLPTGVRAFLPDPGSANGLDRWNIWTRDPQTMAPLRARYIRIQTGGTGSVTFPLGVTGQLGISEVQVFGNPHQEPPQFPEFVCDPSAGDDVFTAVVADNVASPPALRAIQVRGDLQWVGVSAQASHPQCPGFHPGVRRAPIWDSVLVGGTGQISWSVSDQQQSLIGSSSGFSHTARVGAELELEAGVVATVVGGAAYEFAAGVTEESGTSMFWGQSLQYTGTVPGFSRPATACRYRPQPYSYIVSDRSNVGYTHRYTVVDYIVTGQGWSRVGGSPPPPDCYQRPDGVFSNSFEPATP